MGGGRIALICKSSAFMDMHIYISTLPDTDKTNLSGSLDICV